LSRQILICLKNVSIFGGKKMQTLKILRKSRYCLQDYTFLRLKMQFYKAKIFILFQRVTIPALQNKRCSPISSNMSADPWL